MIPTKNRPEDLARAIGSVLRQNYSASELIIVDQSSTDHPHKTVQPLLNSAPQLKVRYLRNPELSGLTAAKNFAIKVATGEILLFIDDDVILHPTFLESIQEAYQQADLDGVGGVFEADPNRSRIYGLISLFFRRGPFRDDRLRLQQKRVRAKSLHPTWLLSGGLSSFKRRVFDKVLFNEALIGASPVEDVDFFSRARGYKFALAPAARAVHNVSTVMRLKPKDFYTAKCQVYALYFQNYVDKNPTNYMAYAWVSIGLLLDAVAKSAVSRNLGPVSGVLKGWREVVKRIREADILSAR